jgi:hypothetical protein
MSLIASAADRLLGAIVPRATASALTCPSGFYRVTCFCKEIAPDGPKVWYDACCQDNGPGCYACEYTVWTC